jgi:hypothetical protein
MIPFMKYFWKKGYVNSTGRELKMIMAYLSWA